MATTNRFGLETFGPEGDLSDNGYKFTLRDRQLLDSLLWTLFNHDHRSQEEADPLLGPQGRPVLTLGSGGVIHAGVTLYYRISYMDASGNETEASISSSVSTPAPLATPVAPFVEAFTTGGNLNTAGTYRYALAHYQAGGKTTRAPNSSAVVLAATTTGSITVELSTLPSGATGWHVYRRDPLSDDYYYLAEVPGPATEFVDDGTLDPDCTRKRPTTNTTNNANSVTVEMDPNDLFLDSRVTAWRIYRSSDGIFGSSSLLATITDTLTIGGTDLVTEYLDVGVPTTIGAPLGQTSVPPAIPGLDASDAFSGTDGTYLPAEVAPQGVQHLYTYLPGVLTDAKIYNQVNPLYDLRIHRAEVFALTAPTGADASNHAVVRVSDDATVNAIQSVWTDAEPTPAVLVIALDATSGTFVIDSGTESTSPISYDATIIDLATALEALTNITTVFVTGTGIVGDPWIVRFLDPVIPDALSIDGAALTDGQSSVITFSVTDPGSEGGTFTLALDTEETTAITNGVVAGDIKTALEALSNITTVNVTGTGTEDDPYQVEFVSPGSQAVPIMYGDDSALSGNLFIEHVQTGYPATTVEIPLSGTGQFFEFIPGDIDIVTLEAEDSVDHEGTEVSDEIALNDVAIELVNVADAVRWNPGVLPAGSYRFRVHAASPTDTSELLLKVSDLGAGGTGSGDIETVQFGVDRSTYTPAYDTGFVSTGAEDIELSAELNLGGPLRIDRLTYEPSLPTLKAGSTVTVDVDIVGSPSTPGSDVQLNIWY